MRVKTTKPVVTFSTTSDAMAMEVLAREKGIPGRIIPVPSQIDAGCGLAWSAEVNQKGELLAGLERYGIAYEGVYDVLLY